MEKHDAGTSSLAIGLMSGTSMDGVDVATLRTDGEAVQGFGPTGFRPYSDAERALLRDALADAISLRDRAARPGRLAAAEAMVTMAHAEAVENFLRAEGLAAADIVAVGFHGQTVLHRPAARLTVQIGDGAALARRLGIVVVHDFRAADVAAGGQGAPFVPVYHAALVRRAGIAGPVCVVNVGGVSNITFIDGDAPPVACDVGPGNALLDDFMLRRTGRAFDEHGATAARGRVDAAFLARAMAHPFFASPPPKSLDRNDFAAFGDPSGDTVDGAATLTALTASGIAAIGAHLPRAPAHWIVAGGGAHNATLMAMLGERLAPARVVTASTLGWQGDALEAQAFAYLAMRRLRELPASFPTTTGVPAPMVGGVIARP